VQIQYQGVVQGDFLSKNYHSGAAVSCKPLAVSLGKVIKLALDQFDVIYGPGGEALGIIVASQYFHLYIIGNLWSAVPSPRSKTT